MVTLKKSKFFIVAIVFLVALGVLGGFSSIASAATVGDRLLQPEEGWKRYDDTEVAFVLKGSWKRGKSPVPSAFYKGTHTGSKVKGDTIEFKFKGTQLRLLTRKGTDRPNNLKIIIDGDEAIFSANGSFTNGFDIVYEKIGLVDKIHKVIIENGNGLFLFDAIDIDEDGQLLPIDYEEPSELVLYGNINEQNENSLTWNAIENATYNVKRATTAGGPYTTIANELTTNSYIDSDVEEGVTYYYVVTAVLNGAESENSNEVALTREGEEPAPQPEPTGNAKLTLHLVDNQIKEYEVTLVEVDKFISWFDNRMSGTGQAYYVFELKHNITPYKAVKEYMVFDKIVWYEVKEY